MGSVGGMLGLAGGAGGTGFGKPALANINNPVTSAQTNTSYDQTQAALTQQLSFLQAAQGQNGLANQSNVYGQLQNIAAGQGPNPAQAMLNNTTGQNVANQAALMASQRGSSASPGMIARQAAQQGAGIQQQAAGQAAALQAQQSLGAIQGAGTIAGQQAGQQAAATNAYTQGTQGQYGQILGAQNSFNNAQVGMQSNINNANASLAGQSMGSLLGQVGGMIGGVAALAAAEGGRVPNKREMYALGGGIDQNQDNFVDSSMSSMGGDPTNLSSPDSDPTKPQSNVGKYLTGVSNILNDAADNQPTPAKAGLMMPQLSDTGPIRGYMAAEGGRVPALVSPGEQYLPPKDVKKVAKGADPLSVGKKIPGKAKVKGNSYANDTVPMTLEEGGIVIPKSVMESKQPHWEAMRFVHAHMAKTKKGM